MTFGRLTSNESSKESRNILILMHTFVCNNYFILSYSYVFCLYGFHLAGSETKEVSHEVEEKRVTCIREGN